jgi:hypothetical protein
MLKDRCRGRLPCTGTQAKTLTQAWAVSSLVPMELQRHSCSPQAAATSEPFGTESRLSCPTSDVPLRVK